MTDSKRAENTCLSPLMDCDIFYHGSASQTSEASYLQGEEICTESRVCSEPLRVRVLMNECISKGKSLLTKRIHFFGFNQNIEHSSYFFICVVKSFHKKQMTNGWYKLEVWKCQEEKTIHKF